MKLAALALTLVRSLPADPALLLARLLVLLWLGFAPSARLEIRRNYRILFGRDRPGFWAANAWQVGRNLMLMARLDSAQARFLIDKAEVSGDNTIRLIMEEVRHSELVEESLFRGEGFLHSGVERPSVEMTSGAVMATFHHGLWEFLPGVFRHRGHQVALVAGVPRGRTLDRMLVALRAREGVRLLRTPAAVARHRFTGLTGFMLDNTSRGKRTSAEAGAVRMEMPEPAFRLARTRATGAQGVLPLFCTLENGRLRVRVYPPGGPDHALACLLAEVRRRPADWVFWGKAGALRA